MDNAVYATLNRQSGLKREMQAVANNIANISTTGFRREGVVFSEYVKALERDPSLSMATANAHVTGLEQGPTAETGGTFDFAIQGDGFFMLEGPDGPLLTRAGSFMPSADSELVNPDGLRLLDASGAPIFVAPDAGQVHLAPDGTLSVDGRPMTQIGLFVPADLSDLAHRDGVTFAAPGGTEPVLDGATILQGFLEGSNVSAIEEVARMIEVQRAYEAGQSFLDQENDRIRAVIRALSG